MTPVCFLIAATAVVFSITTIPVNAYFDACQRAIGLLVEFAFDHVQPL